MQRMMVPGYENMPSWQRFDKAYDSEGVSVNTAYLIGYHTGETDKAYHPTCCGGAPMADGFLCGWEQDDHIRLSWRMGYEDGWRDRR